MAIRQTTPTEQRFLDEVALMNEATAEMINLSRTLSKNGIDSPWLGHYMAEGATATLDAAKIVVEYMDDDDDQCRESCLERIWPIRHYMQRMRSSMQKMFAQ